MAINYHRGYGWFILFTRAAQILRAHFGHHHASNPFRGKVSKVGQVNVLKLPGHQSVYARAIRYLSVLIVEVKADVIYEAIAQVCYSDLRGAALGLL